MARSALLPRVLSAPSTMTPGGPAPALAYAIDVPSFDSPLSINTSLLKPANRFDHPEVAAQVFEVDEDVVELRVAIRIILRHRQQKGIRYEHDRFLGVRKGLSRVVDDFLLAREPHRLRRLVRHLGSRVAATHRVGR